MAMSATEGLPPLQLSLMDKAVQSSSPKFPLSPNVPSPLAAHVKYGKTTEHRMPSRPPTQMSERGGRTAGTIRRREIRALMRQKGMDVSDENIISMMEDEIEGLQRAQDELGDMEDRLRRNMRTFSLQRKQTWSTKLEPPAMSFNRFSMRTPTLKPHHTFLTGGSSIVNDLSVSKIKTVYSR